MRFIPENLKMKWRERPAFRRTALAILLWGISALIFLPNLGYPRAIVFDETYLIPRAQRYQKGLFFQESHPPLGRLIIPLGQAIVHPRETFQNFALVERVNASWPQDQDMTGYRLIPAIIGSLIPVIFFFLAVRMLGSEFFAFILALFVSFDNALLVQSRFALSDSILIACMYLSILAFARVYSTDPLPEVPPWRAWLVWGLLSAAATLVKFSAWFVLVLVPIYMLKLYLGGRRRQLIPFIAAFGAAFLITWVTVWQIHFSLVPTLEPKNTYEISEEHLAILEGRTHPDPVTKFYVQLRDALKFISHYHEGVPDLDLTKPGEIGSAWYQWMLGGRAMSYRWETPDGETYRYVYLIGNPATWFFSLMGVLAGTGMTISDLLFRFLPADRRQWPYLIVVLYWAYMIPPMFVERVLYLYHYLPPLLLGLLLFGIVINEASRLSWRVKLDVLLIALIWVLVGFWLFKPFSYYEPLTDEQLQQRAVWPVWDLRCAKCDATGG